VSACFPFASLPAPPPICISETVLRSLLESSISFAKYTCNSIQGQFGRALVVASLVERLFLAPNSMVEKMFGKTASSVVKYP